MPELVPLGTTAWQRLDQESQEGLIEAAQKHTFGLGERRCDDREIEFATDDGTDDEKTLSGIG